MDIWASHATRKRNCLNCTKQIVPGDRVIVGQWKRTYGWGTRTKRVMSHFTCWVVQAEVYLDDHPYEAPSTAGPGRPHKYNADQRRRRMSLGANIKRWHQKQQTYTGEAMWAMADSYKVKISEARAELVNM